MHPTPTTVEPRDGWRIWLEYDDGACGEVDLSRFAVMPIFAGWRDRSYFEQAHIDEYGAIAWSTDVDLCADALYLELTGRPLEDVMPGLAAELPSDV